MKKILAVDDELPMLKCYEVILKPRGYEVVVTTDPTAVAQLLKDHQFDLVILDVCMPEKGGIEVFQELKRSCPQTAVLFATGYQKSFAMGTEENAEMWQNEFADGNTDILYKPFNVDILYNKVEGLIGPAQDE